MSEEIYAVGTYVSDHMAASETPKETKMDVAPVMTMYWSFPLWMLRSCNKGTKSTISCDFKLFFRFSTLKNISLDGYSLMYLMMYLITLFF